MSPFQTFAVGFDGSPDATAALRWALGLAKAVDAKVVVVHAVGLLEDLHGDTSSGDLGDSVRMLTIEAGIDPADVRLDMSQGDPCSVLSRAAGAPINADLVVVGSRGAGAHSGMLLGSTSLELAEHAMVPLVIVPGHKPQR